MPLNTDRKPAFSTARMIQKLKITEKNQPTKTNELEKSRGSGGIREKQSVRYVT